MGLKMWGLENYECICLDTSPFIYFIDENPKYISKVEKIFSAIANGSTLGVSSYISLLEVLVKPIQNGANDIATQYKDLLLNSYSLKLYPLDDKVAEAAAKLRAKYSGNGFKIKTPDAIQIATGLLNGADVFITNDSGLKNVSEIKVIVLDDIIGEV